MGTVSIYTTEKSGTNLQSTLVRVERSLIVGGFVRECGLLNTADLERVFLSSGAL